MKPWKICKLMIPLLLLCVMVTGCWDARPIDRSSYVTMLGIDMTEQNMFRVFAQVVIPRKLVGGSQGGGGEEKTFAILSAEGATILEALRNMETVESRSLDFGHIRAYIFSEKVARMGLSPLIDLFMRSPQFPSDSWILITREDLGKIMEKKHYAEQMPAVFVDIFFKGTGQQTAQSIPVPLWEFHRNLANSGLEPFAPGLLLKQDVGEAPGGDAKDKKEDEDKEANLQIKGTYLFHRGASVGELSAYETQYLNWFWHKRGFSTLVIEDPRFPDLNQTITIQKADLLVEPFYSPDGQISFRIRFDIVAFFDETLGFTIKENQQMKLTEQTVRHKIEQDLYYFMAKLQQDLRVDPLGLGYKFRRRYPKIWPQINWYEEWPNAFVKIEVDVKLENRGELQ
jgi:spore germination protein KC